MPRDSRLDTRRTLVRGRGLGSRVAGIIAAALLVPNVLAGQNSDTNGVRLFEAGKYKEAKTVFEPAFKANTRDAAAAFYLGRIAEDGHNAGNIRDLEEAGFHVAGQH